VEIQNKQPNLARVLYVDHTAEMGGGEIALFNLVTNVDRARFEPVVLLGASGELEKRLRAQDRTDIVRNGGSRKCRAWLLNGNGRTTRPNFMRA